MAFGLSLDMHGESLIRFAVASDCAEVIAAIGDNAMRLRERWVLLRKLHDLLRKIAELAGAHGVTTWLIETTETFHPLRSQ